MFQQRLHGGATAFPKLAKPEWECCPLQHGVYSLTRDLVLAGMWEKDSKFISCGFGFFLCLQHAGFLCHCLEFPSETRGMG